MKSGKRGDWVQIHKVVLTPGERATQVPHDTKQVPLEMWVKGFLQDASAELGMEVVIKTITGREVKGLLADLKPLYEHDFGEPQQELLTIGSGLRSLLKGVEK